MNNKTPKFLSIFLAQALNKDNKKIPFKSKSEVGKRYFPPVSREWKNSIYVFNKNNIKNMPIYDLNINLLIKSFFNLYFNPKFLYNKYRSYKTRSISLNKIFASKAEVKHTNNKAVITVYVYNREKISLLKKIKKLNKNLFNLIAKFAVILYKKEGGCIRSLAASNPEDMQTSYSSDFKDLAKADNQPVALRSLQEIFKYEKTLTKSFLIKNLRLLRKYKLRLNLNKYKFEEKLLYKLKNFIVKYYNKKVEFNIVNIRSVVFHSDFFTNILLSKLKNRRANILRTMDTILNKVVLPKVNRIIEKSFHIKGIDFKLLENKYLNTKISYILRGGKLDKNLSKFLNKLFYNVMSAAATAAASHQCLNKDYLKIYEIIFNSINYKNMGGVRLEAKGRLTKRYRADRSQFKVRWKGGLKNIDSSYKGLSSINMRGFVKPNIDYSILAYKRRIGAFAVKGWVSGKS
uniref:MtDNA for large subunit rRNA n=1 Tax=Podospora anserina TaxID=2587412 RepID=Q35376_PODAS|nr:ribosomal protein S3 [Podospora anserina]CAA32860.1 unnamed protein product [Podospora anserina]